MYLCKVFISQLLILPLVCQALITPPPPRLPLQNETTSPFSFSYSPPTRFQKSFHFGDEAAQHDQPQPPPVSLPLALSSGRTRGEGLQVGRRNNKNGTGRSSRPSWRNEKTTTTESNLDTYMGSVVSEPIYAGLILPHFIYHRRGYLISVNKAMDSMKQNSEFRTLFENHFKDEPAHHLLIRMLTLFPSPRGKNELSITRFMQLQELHVNVNYC